VYWGAGNGKARDGQMIRVGDSQENVGKQREKGVRNKKKGHDADKDVGHGGGSSGGTGGR